MPALLVACGESEQDKAAKEKYRKALAEYRSDLKEWKKDQVAYDECVDSIDTFRSEMKELDGRLGVGLNFEDYATKVGDVAAAYNQTDFESGGLDCVTEVGLPLETAVGQYEKAYDIWQECFEDIYCENESIDADLQKHWAKATIQIERSDRALERLKVGPRPERPARPTGV